MQVGNKQKLIIMKKLINIFTLFALFAMMFVSCSPDDYSLGSKNVKAEDLVEGIAFKIEHDASNPNIIYLTSLMGNGYTPLWNHPQGRSQKQKVTLKMPFPGTYNVTFGVETPGGIVYGEPVTFTVDDFYADFVNDDVWTMISGGVGKSKTWYLDLDAEGVSRHFLAPMYFFTGTYNWDALHTASGDNYLDADAWDWKKAITPLAGDDGNALWYWLADWPGNKWMCDAADFGTMTFDLIGGANIKVDQQAYGLGSYNGSYMVNVDEHTIAFTDAYPVNVTSRNGEVLAATEFRILYLSEDFMQIMLVPSGTCFNYISKEYKDNWVAGDPEPPYNGNANDDLTSTFTKKWKLSVNTPYNWTGLDGTFLNNWSSPADYSVAGYPYNKSMIDNISLSMTKTGEKTGSYILTDGAAKELKGTYKTDANNNIIFDKDISFAISGSQMLSTTADKALRIIRTEINTFGDLSGIWLGKRDASKSEYMVYHFELSASGDDESVAVKKMLCAHTWKIDVKGTKFGGPLTYADPITFPALTGAWTPGLSDNSWVMIDGDHGSMKFNMDGTVNIIQKTVKDGAFDQTNNLSGTWVYNHDNYSLKLNVPMLHADNFTFAVADWSDSRIQSVGADYLRLSVIRDPDLSGESRWLFVYNYIPAD